MKINFSPYRFAVYFTPSKDSVWWYAGKEWLARCLESNLQLNPIHIPNLSPDEFLMHTSDPRRYGWHATLKAPFKLKSNLSLTDLLDEVHQIANVFSAFDIPPLHVTDHEGFISLRPRGDIAKINKIAETCVTQLQPLAEPLNDAELTRRRKIALTPEQDHLLVTWGYPWVFNQFRFHFSLTGPTKDMETRTRDTLMMAANNHFGKLPHCSFDCLSLFAEPVQGDDFVLIEQVRLSK